jgi:hypothetical protein
MSQRNERNLTLDSRPEAPPVRPSVYAKVLSLHAYEKSLGSTRPIFLRTDGGKIGLCGQFLPEVEEDRHGVEARKGYHLLPKKMLPERIYSMPIDQFKHRGTSRDGSFKNIRGSGDLKQTSIQKK